MEERNILDFLKKVAPGSPIRMAINDLLSAGYGALIVFDSPELEPLCEGGFRVNCRFSSQKLFELCKMDGAIIVSPDLRRILYANVTLYPEKNITTEETGTRHKTAERVAKQASTFVIAVSERKKRTMIYFGQSKYLLKDLESLLIELSRTVQILEKYREIFDELLNKLNILEMSDLVAVSDVCRLLQRAEMIQRIPETARREFTELGKEGSIMRARYKELLRGVDKLADEVIRDYSALSLKKTRTMLSSLSFEGLLDLEPIARLLFNRELNENVSPSVFRFLSKLKMSEKEASELVHKFSSLRAILDARSEEFEDIISERSSRIKDEISNLREQILSGKIVC